MIDYYETKSQPITRLMVLRAYKKVRANHGGPGIDGMKWGELDKNLITNLYITISKKGWRSIYGTLVITTNRWV